MHPSNQIIIVVLLASAGFGVIKADQRNEDVKCLQELEANLVGQEIPSDMVSLLAKVTNDFPNKKMFELTELDISGMYYRPSSCDQFIRQTQEAFASSPGCSLMTNPERFFFALKANVKRGSSVERFFGGSELCHLLLVWQKLV